MADWHLAQEQASSSSALTKPPSSHVDGSVAFPQSVFPSPADTWLTLTLGHVVNRSAIAGLREGGALFVLLAGLPVVAVHAGEEADRHRSGLDSFGGHVIARGLVRLVHGL